MAGTARHPEEPRDHRPSPPADSAPDVLSAAARALRWGRLVFRSTRACAPPPSFLLRRLQPRSFRTVRIRHPPVIPALVLAIAAASSVSAQTGRLNRP